MKASAPWRMEALSPAHHRQSFYCGDVALDVYLQKYASQDAKRQLARIFVACPQNHSEVIGYYTLSAASFQKEDLPLKIAKSLPHYPVPATIIGRLAVDQAWQSQGLGEFLLMDALERVCQVSQLVAIHSIIVDAKNKDAYSFYQRYGFLSFPKQPLRLFLPLKVVEKMIGA